MLHDTAREYRITEAGAKALEARASVPAWYRAVLAQIAATQDPVAPFPIVGRHPRHRIRMWLDEMETLGFIEAVTGGSSFQAKYAPYANRLADVETQ